MSLCGQPYCLSSISPYNSCAYIILISRNPSTSLFVHAPCLRSCCFISPGNSPLSLYFQNTRRQRQHPDPKVEEEPRPGTDTRPWQRFGNERKLRRAAAVWKLRHRDLLPQIRVFRRGSSACGYFPRYCFAGGGWGVRRDSCISRQVGSRNPHFPRTRYPAARGCRYRASHRGPVNQRQSTPYIH